LYRQIGHRRGEAGALANTGVIYRELGRWEEAIRYYEQAIALDRTSGDRPGEAGTLNNLALTRRLVGDFASALADLDRALMLYQTIGDQRGQAATLDNLGLLHQDARQLATAVDYHEQALTIYRTLGLRAGLMSSLGNLGNALAALGKAEAALHHFDQALAITRELKDGDAEARLRVGRGDLYRLQGNLNATRVDYEAALSLIEAQRLELTLNVHRESFLGRERQPVYTRLVRLLVQQGVIQRAWQVCEQSRSRTLLDQLAQSHWPSQQAWITGGGKT
jgi:tetratricopeptide (TPR) repeat protein